MEYTERTYNHNIIIYIIIFNNVCAQSVRPTDYIIYNNNDNNNMSARDWSTSINLRAKRFDGIPKPVVWRRRKFRE